MPRTKPKSPTRFTMKALLPAVVFGSSLCQKPISPQEQKPTPSQPTNMRSRLSPRTRVSIAKVKRLR